MAGSTVTRSFGEDMANARKPRFARRESRPLTDDRGQPHPPRPPDRHAPALIAQRAGRLRAMVVLRPFQLLVLGEAFVVIVFGLSVAMRPSSNSVLLWLAVTLSGAVVLRTMWARFQLTPRPKGVLRYRICPVCFYDLAGQEPESGASVVCPECGAAWRLETPPAVGPR